MSQNSHKLIDVVVALKTIKLYIGLKCHVIQYRCYSYFPFCVKYTNKSETI